MGIDFEKQIREMQQGRQPVVRTQQQPGPGQAPSSGDKDPTAVHFPLKVWMLTIHVLVICGLVGWIVYAAINGFLDHTLMPVFMGGGGILFMMGMLPMSLTLDSRGIHQSYFLGLWTRSIPLNDIRFYWKTTRGELRKSGILGNWNRHNKRNKNDNEEVVYVGSKSSRTYLLHTATHTNREGFIAELEKRGVQPKGYEGWEAFMESRGVPVR